MFDFGFGFLGEDRPQAAKIMIRDSPKLEVFGLRRQDPKRKLSFWKRRFLSKEISKADIVKYLGHDTFDGARRRTLSVRGREQVDGALDDRLLQQTNLYIDLSAADLALKNVRVSLSGNNGSVDGMPISADASTSGSLIYDRKSLYPIFEHGKLGSHIGVGPGSVYPATTEHQQQLPLSLPLLPPLPLQQHYQQQHPGRQQGPHVYKFSNFLFDQLQEATGNFDPGAVIGRGGFGQVYYGELDTGSGKREVAVKDLNPEGVNWQCVVRSFETEVRTLGSLHHVNLVPLLGFCSHDRRRLLVYEFMPNSSLDGFIFRDSKEEEFKLPWRTRLSIAVGVARGLHYLHFECNQTIIHLDIKPQNILLDGRMVQKQADFGIAKLVVDTEQNLGTVTRAQGIKCYLAPETYQSNLVTIQSDVFSFELLLMEILRGKKNSDMPQVDEDSYLTFPLWARKKFRTGQYLRAYEQLGAPLVSPLIPGYQEEEDQRMLCIAIACINEDMVKRPDMRTVLLMLEGREPVPDPSQIRPTVSDEIHNFYEFYVR